jgi:NAD(P)-dependent dehydrogenase (short-subunit alcohol dehydrogenase family)
MKIMITGAASGIGRAVAEILAAKSSEEPVRLLLVDRDKANLDSTASAILERGVDTTTAVVDLAKPEEIEELAHQARVTLGGLDGLVSNAGIVRAGALKSICLEDYEQVFAVNTRATWLLARATYPLLKASRGAIVATASVGASNPTPELGTYSASKAALVMLVRQLALEWGPDGIRCNSVSPASVETPMSKDAYKSPELRIRRSEMSALRRIAHAKEIASVIAFLLSPEASYVTGIDMAVDGGASSMLMQLRSR